MKITSSFYRYSEEFGGQAKCFHQYKSKSISYKEVEAGERWVFVFIGILPPSRYWLLPQTKLFVSLLEREVLKALMFYLLSYICTNCSRRHQALQIPGPNIFNHWQFHKCVKCVLTTCPWNTVSYRPPAIVCPFIFYDSLLTSAFWVCFVTH